MFNINDGSFVIEKYHICISKNFTYQEFLDSKLYQMAVPLITNPPYRSFYLNAPILLFEEKFIIRFYFKDKNLERLHLYLYETDNSLDWEEWSEGAEIKKLVIINELFIRNIGEPPYIYKWGNIEIQYDKRSGDTGIVITYTNS